MLIAARISSFLHEFTQGGFTKAKAKRSGFMKLKISVQEVYDDKRGVSTNRGTPNVEPLMSGSFHFQCLLFAKHVPGECVVFMKFRHEQSADEP